MNKERIDILVEKKKERLPTGVSILGPTELTTEIQADWLVELLGKVYVQHGITKDWESLWLDIVEEKCRPWFAVRDGRPIASAALIKQADGSVEIGRAVSLENGVGGLLMLLAVANHLGNSTGPIVAEVRVSEQFLGVPSGEATQTICFKHLALNPQALMPAFNHGEPNRQEMFLFSSSEKIGASGSIILPDDRASIDLIAKTAMALATDGFQKALEVKTSKEQRSWSRWDMVFQEPFNLVVPGEGSRLETVIGAAGSKSPFTLISLPTNAIHSPAIIECLEAGFIPCGFDRNLDDKGHPVLLLGKLRKGTLLAPIKIVCGLFSPRVVSAINSIDKRFRNS